MFLHGDVLDYPIAAQEREAAPRPRRPAAAWIMVALIAIVIGAAALGAALTTDTRDFAARHHTVLQTQAL